uniref:Pentacotripeptide-repeat region of PRORP domain-containing protein n=1 Tax=Lotus japonicus TaxID=34305 RepID=I3T9G0_LOTJA|nr:unknown [Lotus japonicus]
MNLKLQASIASAVSLPRTRNSIVPSHLNFASSKPLCNYAAPDKLHPRRNGTSNSRSAHKAPHLQKANNNTSIEPKLKLDQSVHQNQDTPFAASSSNADLMSLCEEGKLNQALELMGHGAVADSSVYLALLKLCEDSGSLESGKRVHEFLKKSSFNGEVEVNNRLIGMYGKCGGMKDARRVFDKMPERNLSSWCLMISGYTVNGRGDDGLLVFQQMKQAGVEPDGETFALVLAACARAEAVEEGFMHFESMKEYGIAPCREHYLEVINILGNAGGEE